MINESGLLFWSTLYILYGDVYRYRQNDVTVTPVTLQFKLLFYILYCPCVLRVVNDGDDNNERLLNIISSWRHSKTSLYHRSLIYLQQFTCFPLYYKHYTHGTQEPKTNTKMIKFIRKNLKSEQYKHGGSKTLKSLKYV